jgi:hypothetical protein
VPAAWPKHHLYGLDLAFLTVAAVHGRQVQQVTGGLAMKFDLGYDQPIEVVAYNDRATRPIRCATRSFQLDQGEMEYLCGGFGDGTSGAPWVVDYDPRNGAGTLLGVLGGYEWGGDYQWASYSPHIGSVMQAVFRVAELRSAM